MSKASRRIWMIAILAGMFAAGAAVRTASAQKATPKPQDKLALAESEFKQLLLAMDTDARGKISKQDMMKFVEAEFERLDKDKTGELDAKALTQPQIQAKAFVGK